MDKICGHAPHKACLSEAMNAERARHVFVYGQAGIGKAMLCRAYIDGLRSTRPVELLTIDSAKPLHGQLLNFSMKFFMGLKVVFFNQIILSEQDLRTVLLFCDLPEKLIFVFALDSEYPLPYQLVRKTLLCQLDPPSTAECVAFFKDFPVNFYERTHNIGKAIMYHSFYGEDETLDKVDSAIEVFLETGSKTILFELLDEDHSVQDILYRIYMRIYERPEARSCAIHLLRAMNKLKHKNAQMVGRVVLHKIHSPRLLSAQHALGDGKDPIAVDHIHSAA